MGRASPLYVLPTGGGNRYGDFVLDEASRSYLTAHLADVPEPLTRGRRSSRSGRKCSTAVAPEVMFQTLTDALPRESDELTVQRMLSMRSRSSGSS